MNKFSTRKFAWKICCGGFATSTMPPQNNIQTGSNIYFKPSPKKNKLPRNFFGSQAICCYRPFALRPHLTVSLPFRLRTVYLLRTYALRGRSGGIVERRSRSTIPPTPTFNYVSLLLSIQPHPFKQFSDRLLLNYNE